mmetsp:Transcript_16254/g.42755  ORF Transcript_16254/g.42755 Transcript_16254/m.42755 type:complete len:243 (-) Transcript_16254:133-861(-)
MRVRSLLNSSSGLYAALADRIRRAFCLSLNPVVQSRRKRNSRGPAPILALLRPSWWIIGWPHPSGEAQGSEHAVPPRGLPGSRPNGCIRRWRRPRPQRPRPTWRRWRTAVLLVLVLARSVGGGAGRPGAGVLVLVLVLGPVFTSPSVELVASEHPKTQRCGQLRRRVCFSCVIPQRLSFLQRNRPRAAAAAAAIAAAGAVMESAFHIGLMLQRFSHSADSRFGDDSVLIAIDEGELLEGYLR